ncbi:MULTISPECIES: serine/threonine protein kinase [unclassified Streptomyces]|uniref:serine/threonine protein kinase n=1 Tax=unclassified Streptomyces TaxID=2593676 RepID=UPI00068FFE6B|nr:MULTISPECIES: serine/threonine protein kinase [unclassified Streptomyces]KOV93132.1 serine/threonine protein kinase [Streptomyces sp. NRRL B-3648]
MHATGRATDVAAGGGAGRAAGSRRRVGPYVVITALDDPRTRVPVPERRYIARSADGRHTVLLSLPHEGADPRPFLAEADASRHLLGPASAPATALAAPGEPAWYARPYLPVLPLPTALAVHGGPLPERTVRALGVALAETLAVLHGQGLTFAGVSPAAVLLAADGPRLSCYGAVRAAAPDGTPRSGLPGLEPGSLPPEQATGGRPRPLGDVYALGATLAYAATGHTAPERDELPAAFRTVIGRCLTRDPGARPQLAELIDALAGGDPSGSAALLAPGWLPGRVIAALAHQSAALLTAEIPAEAVAAPLTTATPHRD